KSQHMKTKPYLNRRNGVIHDAGSSLWPQSNQSSKDHGKDMEASGVSGMGVEASGDNGTETEDSEDSGKAIEAPEDSDQEVATEVTDPKTKAKSGVS
ncbi:hypothetical protein P7K49_023992, partial [Saguinus oedipus]